MSLTLFVAWPAEDRAGHALRRALDHALAALPGGPAGRRLESVLIDAAGAPAAAAVAGLLADVGGRLAPAPDLEATLSVDPRAITVQDIAAYRAAGINRLAVPAGMLDAAAQAVLAGALGLFPRIAVDLSFGRPGQSLADWRSELARALQLGAGHISIEEHVPAEGAGAVDSDLSASCYLCACADLDAAGMPPYEIAHFARPGQESRQLLHGATGGDYLGIGPGAVGRIRDGRVCLALTQITPACAWLEAVASGAESVHEPLRMEQRLTELLQTGLRLRAGIERTWFEPLVEGRLETMLDSERLAPLIEDGFVVLDRCGLRLGERGWPLCDAVLDRLLA